MSEMGQSGVPSPAVCAYDDGQVQVWHGDAQQTMLAVASEVDAIVTDPPYGDTSLVWDRRPDPAWLDAARLLTRQLWCFGSFRFHITEAGQFTARGWLIGQDNIWEKHNGSGFHSDRFKRVHEIVAHWYHGPWNSLYTDPPIEQGHRRVRATRRANGTPHTGEVGESTYDSTDRVMRSVQYVRSEHGRAVHPTQKPTGILRPLIEYSVPPGGIVMDPFGGSGSTAVAARECGRRAIVIEAREQYVEATIARFAQGVLA